MKLNTFSALIMLAMSFMCGWAINDIVSAQTPDDTYAYMAFSNSPKGTNADVYLFKPRAGQLLPDFQFHAGRTEKYFQFAVYKYGQRITYAHGLAEIMAREKLQWESEPHIRESP